MRPHQVIKVGAVVNVDPTAIARAFADDPAWPSPPQPTSAPAEEVAPSNRDRDAPSVNPETEE